MGYNLRDLRIAIALGFGYPQTRIEELGTTGLQYKGILKRIARNGDWIREVAAEVELFARREKVEIEAIAKEKLEERFESLLGPAMRNIEQGLADPSDPKRRDDNSWKVVEQVRPKKTIVQNTGKVLHAHAHAVLSLPPEEAEAAQRVFGKQVAFLASAPPPVSEEEEDDEVIDGELAESGG